MASFVKQCVWGENNLWSDSPQPCNLSQNKQQLLQYPLFFLSPCATAFTLQHIAGILQQLRKASTESTSRLWPWCARRRQPLSTSCCAQRILRKQQRTAPGRNGTTTFYCVFCARWKLKSMMNFEHGRILYVCSLRQIPTFLLNNDIWGGWESE